MLTLKDCIEYAKQFSDEPDLYAIRLYFSQEGMATKGLELLGEVTKDRVRYLESYENNVKAQLCFSNYYYYKKYSLDTAEMLDSLTRKMQLQMEFNEKDILFMKSFPIPKDGPFWRDLAEAMRAAQEPNYIPRYYNYQKGGSIGKDSNYA